ncbi:MAG: hypothetical protein N3B13_03105 [Deltaproteobacteria bacterium]|nr:hypothetical protein [Deltaproteobacteria bacterium]
MKRLIRPLFPALIFLMVSNLIFAEDYSAKIKKIADLYDSMEYEKCLQEINQTEQYKFNMKKDELLEIYKYKAFIYILSDRKALAENVIKDIYEIDADYTLPPSVSPKLREPFARIKKTIKKDEPPKTKVIEAKPVKSDIDERVTIISGPVKKTEKENFFKENIIPLSIVAGGIALFVPGLIVRLNAASDAEDYRNKLKNAPKDELGNVIGITKAEAQQKQDDINTNVMIGNTLITVGSLAVVGGVATYFVLDKIKKDGKKEKVSLTINENGFVIVGSYDF